MGGKVISIPDFLKKFPRIILQYNYTYLEVLHFSWRLLKLGHPTTFQFWGSINFYDYACFLSDLSLNILIKKNVKCYGLFESRVCSLGLKKYGFKLETRVFCLSLLEQLISEPRNSWLLFLIFQFISWQGGQLPFLPQRVVAYVSHHVAKSTEIASQGKSWRVAGG